MRAIFTYGQQIDSSISSLSLKFDKIAYIIFSSNKCLLKTCWINGILRLIILSIRISRLVHKLGWFRASLMLLLRCCSIRNLFYKVFLQRCSSFYSIASNINIAVLEKKFQYYKFKRVLSKLRKVSKLSWNILTKYKNLIFVWFFWFV